MDIISDPEKLKKSVAKVDGPGETFKLVKKLEAAVQELEKELKEGEYDYFSIVADLLVDVQNQMSQFDVYVALPHIALIKRKVDAIESELRRQVQWIFREIGPLASSETYGMDANAVDSEPVLDLSAMNKVDVVVDALGEHFRKDLLGRFAQLQLIPYEKLFKMGGTHSGLEFLENRYAWFKYLLHVVDSKFGDMLPTSWGIPYHLFNEFCRRTKKHISDILAAAEKENPEPTSHVAFLLKAVKSVVAFEAEMTASFTAKSRAASGDDVTYTPSESIVDAFDPYLGPYVQMERQGLEELMQEVLRAEENEEGAKGSDPYVSSSKMFEYIKGSLKRCTGFSTGITYLSLSKEFRICLQQYSESLKFRCPTPTFVKGSKTPVYRITKTMETTLCRIIRTGEYCVDTIPALEASMKQRIQKVYVDEVDFSSQIDAFMDMVSFAMGVLAAGEINRMEDSFADMKKVNWGLLDNVGDVNDYIKKMLKILSDCVPRIRLTMSNVFFQNMCSKLATVFLDAFNDSIWSLRRICQTGGAQLLMDLNGIKEYLVKMPNVRLPPDVEPPVISKPYLSTVSIKVKKIEIILKLVCTDANMMEEMFAALWPEGTAADLEAITALKGTGKNVVPLDHVKDIISVANNTGTDVGKNITKKFDKVKGGLRSAMGDMIGGNLFDNSSGHGSTDDHHNSGGSTHSGAGAGDHSSLGSKAMGEMKHALGGINAALGFKKAGAAAGTGSNGSSTTGASSGSSGPTNPFKKG